MAVARIPFSGSTHGRSVLVVATSSAGDTVHTAAAGTTGGLGDYVYIWAHNIHTANVDLTIQFGGTTAPGDNHTYTIPPKNTEILVVPGWHLRNSLVVKAFATTTNVVLLTGYVDLIT